MLQLVLCVLIDIFLVVGNNGFGDRLTDGVDLRSVTTSSNPDSDVDFGEFVETDNQERFVDLNETVLCEILTLPFFSHLTFGINSRIAYLESKDFWLDEGERFAIDLDEAFAFLF